MKNLYKVILLMIGISVLLNFNSCKKDENKYFSIAGIWKQKEFIDKVYINGELKNTQTGSVSSILTFDIDGTGIEKTENGEIISTFEWIHERDTLTMIDENLENGQLLFNLKIRNNNLIELNRETVFEMMIDGVRITNKIVSLRACLNFINHHSNGSHEYPALA